MSDFKVCCSPLTSEIFVGTVSKNGLWGKKHNVTDTAVGAVAQHLHQKKEELRFRYKGKDYALRVVDLTPNETNDLNTIQAVATNVSLVGKEAKESFNELVFLVKHPDYPNLKSIDEMPNCKVEPLFDCNGLCGINDFDRNKTEKEINYQGSLFYNIP